MKDLLRLDLLARIFMQISADLFPFCKFGGLLYLACEKIHSMLHSATEIMRWGSLINSSGETNESTLKAGLGVKLHHRDTDGSTLFKVTPDRRRQLKC
jgi:hypothetical protein